MNRFPMLHAVRSMFDRDRSTIEQIQTMRAKFACLSDVELEAAASKTQDLPRWIALAATAAWRVLRQEMYEVQLRGALALARGSIAEMQTGEGKTLTAVPAISWFAREHRGVHVMTVNDSAPWVKWSMRLSLLCWVLVGGAVRAQNASVPPFAAPGRLIDLGGWRVHLNCSGQPNPSRPVVILEAGAGDFSVDWSLVQPRIAPMARVCSYDRAGSGWSDLGPRPRTMRQQVWELHALLEKAGEKPPFVLVGHSYGGWLTRLFAETYPTEVAGLVLVESGAEDPLRIIDGKVTHASELAKGQTVPPVRTSDPLRESDIPPRIIGLIQSSIRAMGGHLNDPPRDKLPLEARRMREWSLSQIKHAASNDNPFEADELAAMLAERKKKQNVVGDLPLVVISRGLLDEEGPRAVQREETHRKDQSALVTLSSAGRLVIAAKSGHHVPLDEPDVVTSAVRQIVEPVRH